MDNGAAVSVRDLRKSYHDVTAVAGIDFEIARGEVFALLGPNGAGKTTTVEILEGFRRRDQGSVSVLGQDPAQGGRAWRARIGIVLQLPDAGPELTVLEIVRHFAAFYPRSRPPEEAIDLVGLTAKARSRISKLSGGQTRRLDVALGGWGVRPHRGRDHRYRAGPAAPAGREPVTAATTRAASVRSGRTTSAPAVTSEAAE